MRTRIAPAFYALLLGCASFVARAQDESLGNAVGAMTDRAKPLFQAAAPQIALKDLAAAKTGLAKLQAQVREDSKAVLASAGFRALVVQVTYLRRLERGEALGSVRRVYETVPIYVAGGDEVLAGQSVTEVQSAVGASKAHCRGLVAPPSLDADMLGQFMACLYIK